MATQFSRRKFLRMSARAGGALAAGGLVAALVASSKSPNEPLPNNLRYIVNRLAIETIKGGGFSRTGGFYNEYHLTSSDYWVPSASEELIQEVYKDIQGKGLTPLQIDSLVLPLVEARKEKLKAQEKTSPLSIDRIVVFDNTSYATRVWSRGDRFEVYVSDKDGYRDKFVFYGHENLPELVNRRDPNYSRNLKVFYSSKPQNVKNIQAAYGVSEEEARRRVEELLPSILIKAEELFVAPQFLPYEKWVPFEKQGTPTKLRSKI